MKKTLTFLLSTMMLTAALTSCSSDDSNTATSSPTSSSSSSSASSSSSDSTNASTKEADGIITMGGSTSVEAIIEVMEEVYEGAMGIDMSYSPTGSSTGVTGAIDQTLDIGLASRELKDSEIADGAKAITFALDGIAVVVNASNTVTDISMEDLAKICSSEITDWSELGGDAGEIMLIGRDSASGTRDGFESIVGVEVEIYAEEHASTGAVIASIQGIPGAIGYVSLSAVDEKVSPLSVDGVSASEETVKDGTYPIQRPFIFVVNENVNDPEVDEFIQWALSEEGAVLVEAKGAVAP